MTRQDRHSVEKYTYPQVGVVLVREVENGIPGEWERKELLV